MFDWITPELGTALQQIVALIVTTVLVPWLAVRINTLIGTKLDDSARSALQTSLTNAAGLLVQGGMTTISGVLTKAKKEKIAEAVKYVEDAAPGAVKRFDLKPAEIAEKLQAKLGVVKP